MTIDYIEKITLQEELKNVKEQLKTVQDENAKLKTDIDLYCKANEEKAEKIKRLSEELDSIKYTNLILRTNAATKAFDARIETLENDRSELLAAHIADVETINKLNIRACGLNSTISTLLERVSTYDKENQELKNKVKSLEEEIRHLQWGKDHLAKQVEHLQSCLDLEKNKD